MNDTENQHLFWEDILMIVVAAFEGKPLPFGTPMNDLRGEKLLKFIEMQMELGREVHISPEPGDYWSPDTESLWRKMP